MKNLQNALIINGVAYTLSSTEAKKIASLLGITTPAQSLSVAEKPQPEKQPEKNTRAKKEAPKAAQPEKQAPKNTLRTVGSLEQDGAYVRTVADKFISSKARYAIKMSATEDFGATKLGHGDKTYESLAKADKYVQVYKFKSVEDATRFMDEQSKRLDK